VPSLFCLDNNAKRHLLRVRWRTALGNRLGLRNRAGGTLRNKRRRRSDARVGAVGGGLATRCGHRRRAALRGRASGRDRGAMRNGTRGRQRVGRARVGARRAVGWCVGQGVLRARRGARASDAVRRAAVHHKQLQVSARVHVAALSARTLVARAIAVDLRFRGTTSINVVATGIAAVANALQPVGDAVVDLKLRARKHCAVRIIARLHSARGQHSGAWRRSSHHIQRALACGAVHRDSERRHKVATGKRVRVACNGRAPAASNRQVAVH